MKYKVIIVFSIVLYIISALVIPVNENFGYLCGLFFASFMFSLAKIVNKKIKV